MTIAPAQARRKRVAQAFGHLFCSRKKPGKERLSSYFAQPLDAPALEKLSIKRDAYLYIPLITIRLDIPQNSGAMLRNINRLTV